LALLETGLDNELLALDTGLENSAMAAEGEAGYDYGGYGNHLNWQDSYGPAKKRLGVTEEQWEAFIAGVNDIKQRSYEANIGNPFTGKGGLYGPKVEGSGGPGQIDPEYKALMDELNALYETVGLGPKAGVIGDGERENLRFDFVTGDMVYETGDLIHQFGKGLVTAVGGAMFGAGFSSFLSSSFGLSSAVANKISNFVVSTVTGSGGDIGLEDVLFMALGPTGEFADAVDGTGQAIIDAITDYVTDPDNYDNDNEIVWGEIDYEGIEGEFDPDAPANPYDPDLIDPQLPQYPKDGEDGGAGTEPSDEVVADPSNNGAPIENEGQYKVIEKTDKGVVVRDRTDGDIWIIQGDYQIGDIVSEDEMADATGGGVDPQNNGANTEDASPQDGDACDLGGGNTGVIKDGKCVATSATLPNTGIWPSSTSPNNTGEPPPTSTTSTTTTQSPSTTPTTTTTPSTNTSSSNQPAGEIVGTGVWPASGTGGGTGAGNGPEGSGDGDGGGDGDGNGGDGDGDGDGDGNGLSNLAASRGSSKAHWDRLFAAKEFQSRRGQFGKPTGTSRELNSSNYQMRQNIMNSLWDDLA
jgi:hypothetical protein